MSRKNFKILITILIIVLIIVVGYLYFRQPASTPTGEPGGPNFFSYFNPFGTSKPTPPPVTPPAIVPISPGPVAETLNLKLKKISSMPIAGFGVFQKERFKDILTPPPVSTSVIKTPTLPPIEFMPALRYVERATGNIYQTFADKIKEQKFSTTIIPKIYEAYLGNKGGSVILRYLKSYDRTIETFVGSLPKEILGKETSNNEVKGTFLPENISDMSVSADTLKIFYLFNVGDSATGIISDLLSNKKIQVFSSPFTEWLSSWPNSRMITLTTKPSGAVPGYMYAFDPNSKGGINKILGGINGLTTLTSPDGKLVLYADNNLTLNIFHTDTKISDTLGAKTLPEKCIWNKGGKTNTFIYCAVPKHIGASSYPDAWYQGEVSFSDEIWKIDVQKGNATMIANPTAEANEEIDGIKLALDETENYLFFVNKKDSYLWELYLK